MPAFRAAFADGAPWVETDVQPTADDVLVLLHDDTVDRTTDGAGAIRTLTGADAARLDAGSWFGHEFAGTRIPLLTELLAEITGDRRLLLEVKGEHTSEQLALLLGSIERSGSAERVFLQSFELPVLRALRVLRPRDPFGLLVEVLDADPVATCRELGATAYNPDVIELLRRPALVAELHAAGIATTPWTADTADQWEALTELGVDGIITNRPAGLIAWLAEQRGHERV